MILRYGNIVGMKEKLETKLVTETMVYGVSCRAEVQDGKVTNLRLMVVSVKRG